MKKKLFVIVLIFLCFTNSCKKNDGSQESNEIVLISPDKKIELGNKVSDLINDINIALETNSVVSIDKIEYPHIEKGNYAIVSFKKEDGTVSNMIYSRFLFNLKAKKINFKKTDQKKLGQNYQIPTCYKFWCTPDGNCSNCQVLINDPFGNPTLQCSCEECHLNGQQVQCPD